MRAWVVRCCAVLCAAVGACASSSPNRTVIFMYYTTVPDQDLFVRGGLDAAQHTGCTEDVTTDTCAIPIRTHLLGTIEHYDRYNSWRVGDDHLDWHGAEDGQGSYGGVEAVGTPLAWTTDNVLSPGYQELNTFGDHYWMVDMEMDCSRTDGGWFVLKGYVTNSATAWESDIAQGACSGTVGGSVPYPSVNHAGLFGAVNVFTFNQPDCIINAFTS